MSRILITGASGFIGTALVKALESSSHTLIALKGRKDLDLTNAQALSSLPKADICIHLAGSGNPTDFDKNREQAWQNNLTGTLNLLQATTRLNYKRFILASTYVYGKPHYLPVDENHPVNPPHPYPESKYLCEQLLKRFSKDTGIEGIALRIFNVYGQGQTEHMLIPFIIGQLNKKAITLRDAKPRRDFVHINDVVRAFLKTINKPLNKPLDNSQENFTALNIGSGESISVDHLVQKILFLSKKTLPVTYKNEVRTGEVNDVVANIDQAQKQLQWKPEVSLDEGLKELLQ